MKIKFNRSILVAGEHHEAGSIADIPLPLSAELISWGDCIRLDESPAIEDASAPTEQRENAMKQTRKKPK